MKPNRFRFLAPSVFQAPLRYGAPVFTGLIVTIAGLDARGGDILRAGAGGAPGTAGGSSAGTPSTPVSSQVAHANARDTLARTTRALDAMKAVQAAARAAAAAGPNSLGTTSAPLPTVPNGLGAGGLLATGGNSAPTHWVGAGAPTQQVADGKTTVTIKQTAQQALLQWETFNVGRETTVTFDQKAGGENVGQWIAFNQVNDLSANPSQILGNIKADGQIYLINRNGIIFGGSSQVNARGLTVSSLPINTNLIDRGLLNNPDAQFLFSGLNLPAGLNGTLAFTPEAAPLPGGKYGDVVVEQGAILESPTNSAKTGGRITLVGPNVINRGSILTPDGQAILAAGLQVGFDGHASSDPSLRGLDVFVGAVADPLAGGYAGTVTQDGLVEARRGAITLAGKSINQNGALSSTTSVSLNGRIDLQANYNAISNRASANASGALFLTRSSGAIEIGAKANISILPEYDSKETTIGTELALRSKINLSGKTIHLGEDSLVVAPNAVAALTAGTWISTGTAATPAWTFVQSGGQIYLDKGASIDIGGTLDASASVAQNFISVDLRSAELADSPLQRLGVLRNSTIEVDTRVSGDGWIGTPLANVSGFANLIERSVAQLTVAGGTLSLSAGESVVLGEGSRIDVSGGSTKFEGAMVRTTRLMQGGRLVDIGAASPEVVYDGIYDGSFTEANSKFGISNIYDGVIAPSGARYEAGYTQGAKGGSLSITAPSMALDGNLAGNTVIGEKQRQSPAPAASLSLSFTSLDLSYPNLPAFSPTPPAITFLSQRNQAPAIPHAVDGSGNPLPLPAERIATVELSADLLSTSGFGSFNLTNPDGDITIPEGVNLVSAPGGAIVMTGSNIRVDGRIISPGGSISLSASNLPLAKLNYLNNTIGQSLPIGDPSRGNFTLGANGVVSTAGQIIDDRLNNDLAAVTPFGTAGGTINIQSYSAHLGEGGLLDVSGGVYLNPRGQITYGNAGKLSLAVGRDLRLPTVLGGTLTLGSTFAGFSGANGGSLTLQAPAIQIGGSTGNPRITRLDEGFFSQGGFSSFSLTGLGLESGTPGQFVTGLRVDSTARIRPEVASVVLDTAGGGFSLRQVTLEEGTRKPVSLSLGAQGAINSFNSQILGVGEVVLESGSLIETDARGSVTFNAEVVTLHGSVSTPGGSIQIAGAPRFPSIDPDSLLPTVLIGSQARLSASGKTVLNRNPLGLRQGTVLDGGSIAISGNVVAERGAIFDVSGTSGTLDQPASQASLTNTGGTGTPLVPVRIESNGGRITLSGSRMLYSDATLVGHAGGGSAIGGSVQVSSGRFTPQGTASNMAEENLIVRQTGSFVPDGFVAGGIGAALVDSQGNALPGIGNFSVSTMADGGFHSLALNGNVTFDGNVAIHLPGALRIASGGVIRANGRTDLSAGYIQAGQAFRPPSLPTETIIRFTQTDGAGVTNPFTFAPTYGSASLALNAQLIDIGDLSLQNIGQTTMTAAQGDIRGNGALSMAGALSLTAGQIYPTSANTLDLFVYDYTDGGAAREGNVTIHAGASRQIPLSAGGTLGIYASTIRQEGTLRAPIGTINLGWDGSGSARAKDPIAGSNRPLPITRSLTIATGSMTSTSAVNPANGKGLVIPYGISLDGTSWIDPAGNDITIRGTPSQSVNLAAVNLHTESGSTVDISGGGDLYAYRWVAGNGGTKDILSSTSSFAILPGYAANHSPYGAFNTDSAAVNLGGQTGYVNANLKPGDQITLAHSKILPAGTYTLLPARYALLPGALLVTPKASAPGTAADTAAGAGIIAGYISNNLDPARTGSTRIQGFEVAPAKTFRERAEYRDLFANTFLREAAISRDFVVPRLPVDAGRLSFTSNAGMTLAGDVASLAAPGGRGAMIDINSSSDILINTTGTGNAGLVLDVDTLNRFGAESLLIGGLRSTGEAGITVTAGTSSLTLDNEGVALVGKDVILVSKGTVELTDGAAIESAADDIALDSIVLGDAKLPGSGNGALVRVSANDSGKVSRLGVSLPNDAGVVIRPGVSLSGGGIVLDSTAGTDLADSARLIAKSVSLTSGQISIALDNAGAIQATDGLILGGAALAGLQASANRLELLSYSTIDVYGSGNVGRRDAGSLSLQAAAIRGFNTGESPAVFSSPELLLGNAAGVTAPSSLPPATGGELVFDANLIRMGANELRLEGYAKSTLSATGAILATDKGALQVAGALDLVTPRLTGAAASKYHIASSGVLELTKPTTDQPLPFVGGLGADLTLQGSALRVNGDITLPSGSLTLRAVTGDVEIGADQAVKIDLAGSARRFLDVTRFTRGGTLNLKADTGSIHVAGGATLDVSANPGGGDAGSIHASSPMGGLSIEGSIRGGAGNSGNQGWFSLDASTLAGGSLAPLDAILNEGGFTQIRDYRIRNGNVDIDGVATALTYRVSADSGNITVSSTINASGATGGTVDLKANGSLTVVAGSRIDASAARFDSAGKGGAVILEAGNQRNGVTQNSAVLDLRSGSVIDLSVAEANASDQAAGRFTGTLHLRAPRNVSNSDLQVNAVGSTIQGASAVLVEGVKLYNLTGTSAISTTVQNAIQNDANAFLGAVGTTTTGYTAMYNRLTSQQPGLDLILAPGAEVFNLNGSLTLGTASSSTSSDWNLSSFRFGPRSAAGVLTLRASENLTFFNALSDGFAGGSSLWLSPLMANNPMLPANMQSWSYRIAAGADLSAASFRSVTPATLLGEGRGLLQLGKDAGSATVTGGAGALTSAIAATRFQVIRTGSGNIDIHTSRSVQLLNPFAGIYTAGTQVANPTTVAAPGDFVTPITARNIQQGNLGAIQQNFTAQYSMAGGNVVISSGENIERKSRNNSGLIDDSSRQLPNNWLYRRSYVDTAGQFGQIRIGSGIGATSDPAASTTWWVDFSNFFQGVGALGGGNITMSAGINVSNIDAVIPTNYRAARGTAAEAASVELGGGSLRVRAGNDLSGGIYYVERGKGELLANGAITTNATRSPSFGLVGNLNNPAAAQLDPLTWMPTTLFVGKSSFDLVAGGDLLIGPAANPFLLPQGVNNKFWYKSYFSTVSPDSTVRALSVGGRLTYRNAVSLPSPGQAVPMLRAWHETQLLLGGSASSTAWFQPWLRLNETSLQPFSPVWSLTAGSVFLTSLAGDINLAGDLTTSPAATGQIEVLAAGSIKALQPVGVSTVTGGSAARIWSSSTFNLSDANPLLVPSAKSPLTSVGLTSGGVATLTSNTVADFMSGLSGLFTESGSVTGANAVLQTRQARHTAGGLHIGDTQPLRIHSLDGDLSGLTLFSAKQSRITAASDISDIAFYIQNNLSGDISVISAGGSITAYDSANPLRVASLAPGNALGSGQTPLAGDIQISGPGTLQVLAGQNLNLGTGAGNPDGTGTGITSIGNLRNPYLAPSGADIFLGAGVGPASSLSDSNLALDEFVNELMNTPAGSRYLAEAKGILGIVTDFEATRALESGIRIKSITPGGAAEQAGLAEGDVLLQVGDQLIAANYDDSYLTSAMTPGQPVTAKVLRNGLLLDLTITPGADLLDLADPDLATGQRDQLAMSLFHLALRDAGRDFNDPLSRGYRKSDAGFAAIKKLFPESQTWKGEILTQGRDIRTRSGGNISIFAPGGGLTMADTTIGNPLTPPGIVTESGGGISLFARDSVSIGIGRIFTLKGGDVSIWSSKGDIAAGSSSRTVSSAPPTRVVIDPQSASVQTDLAGLATGGGIGVLATVEGVAPGDVDFIAPSGVIDAGDAGIRVSGNINLAAVTVVNAGNISAGGSSTGAPVAVSAPSVSVVTSASNSAAAGSAPVSSAAGEQPREAGEKAAEDQLSVYVVEVIGYGGGSDDEDDDQNRGSGENQ